MHFHIKLTKILYHSFLLLDRYRFCETHFTTYRSWLIAKFCLSCWNNETWISPKWSLMHWASLISLQVCTRMTLSWLALSGSRVWTLITLRVITLRHWRPTDTRWLCWHTQSFLLLSCTPSTCVWAGSRFSQSSEPKAWQALKDLHDYSESIAASIRALPRLAEGPPCLASQLHHAAG